MTKQALEGKRINAFAMDPDDLTIVGLDVEAGPEHPLYDERVHLPLEESLVLSIIDKGVKVVVLVRKNGDSVEVVDGRRRVLHAREANDRLTKSGEPLVTVPVMLEKGTDLSAQETAVALNELRVQDEIMVKAKKAGRMLDRNQGDLEATARAFGVTTQTIKNWQKLMDLSPKVHKAVDGGKLAPSAAVKLSGLSREEQEQELDKLLEAGGKATMQEAEKAAKVRKNKRNGGDGEVLVAPSKRTLRRLVEAWHEYPKTEVEEEFIRGVRFAVGELDPASVKGLKAILNEI